MHNDLILITLSGNDHPGISAALLNCIKDHDIKIEDIGQSLTHGVLSLSVLISCHHDGIQNSPLLKSLEKTALKLKMELSIKKIDSKDDVSFCGEKYILSCVGLSGISANFLFDVTTLFAKLNINIQRIHNMTENELKALDIFITSKDLHTDWEGLKEELIIISQKHCLDVALLKDDVWRRNKRLIVFDMDSTLIQSEVIVDMAKKYGVGEDVHLITEKAMNGEFDFDQSLIKRVQLLKGMKEKDLAAILSNIKLSIGVTDFIKTVKSLGYKVAIISGGFTYFANYFKQSLNLDYAFSNELEISDGILTGCIKGSILNADKKAMILELIAQQEGIKLEQVVAIGDGANDLPMLQKAGLGIAFHAKDFVKKNTKQHMSYGPMDSILYFLGIPGAQDYK